MAGSPSTRPDVVQPPRGLTRAAQAHDDEVLVLWAREEFGVLAVPSVVGLDRPKENGIPRQE
jgi:hypothetical protein